MALFTVRCKNPHKPDAWFDLPQLEVETEAAALAAAREIAEDIVLSVDFWLFTVIHQQTVIDL